jgi:hypothetical protein
MFEKAFAAASDFDHIGLLVRRKICHSGAQGATDAGVVAISPTPRARA